MKKMMVAAMAAVSVMTATAEYRPARAPLMTDWGTKVTPENAWRGYPRPQMVRKGWSNLNGLWKFSVVTNDIYGYSLEIAKGDVLVPYPLESALSGVGRLTGKNEMVEYRRTFATMRQKGVRQILRFEGVDYRAQVFVNGVEAGVPHEGAYTAFAYDVTDLVKDGENELMVRVWDPTEGYVNPLGKQSVTPKGCFYTRVSGIWQTVWLEKVPVSSIESFNVIPDIDKGTATFVFTGRGPIAGGVTVTVDGAGAGKSAAIDRPITVNVPNPRLWSPEDPQLYTFTATYGNDKVTGYFAMRKFEKRKDAKGVLRFFLNNKPYFIVGTLDQGWWPDGLFTPPSEEAMENDIRTLKLCGYNMMRKHIKVEPMRYYALCDRIGMLVLQDMPSGDCNTMFSRDHANVAYGSVRREWQAVMDRLMAVPSIVMWIPYNEQWTQPGERLTLDTLRWTRAYDPSHRLVNGPSGWVDYEGGDSWPGAGGRCSSKHKPDGEEEACDVIDRHDYDFRPTMIPVNSHRVSFLGEYGGVGCRVDGHLWTTNAWGYGNTGKDIDRKAVEKKYLDLTAHVETLAAKGLAGCVYTQTTDVEQEINGLMTYDRKVLKFSPAALKAAHERLCATALKAAEAK